MEILVILLLILLNGLFAMSEIALISARRSNLEMQARQGSAGARQALKLAKDPDRFLSTVQIGITLIGILTGIYSGDTLAAKFGGELARLGIPLRTATVTAQVTIVIAVTYLTIIFGELVPKRIGMNAAERAAKIVARPMRLLSVAASPFVWLLSRSTAGVARLLGLQRAESKVTEAEIRSIIQEGAEDGEVQAVEQQIMGRVFSLGDRTVESIMTHRSELAWIDAAASAAQIRETVARAPHNRYPVGEGSLDKLLGVVCLKDLFLHLGDEEFDLRRLVAPAKFFHEGVRGLQRPRTAAHGAAGLRHHLRRIRRDARHHHPARHFRSPGRRTARPARGTGHRPARRRQLFGRPGNALSTTFSTGSVWKTPCPATPTTPSAA